MGPLTSDLPLSVTVIPKELCSIKKPANYVKVQKSVNVLTITLQYFLSRLTRDCSSLRNTPAKIEQNLS
jgi:hypothetical protein